MRQIILRSRTQFNYKIPFYKLSLYKHKSVTKFFKIKSFTTIFRISQLFYLVPTLD